MHPTNFRLKLNLYLRSNTRMAFAPLSELKNFDKETLNKEIVATKKQLFELRLKKATRQSFKPHLFKHSKRKIAQLLTLESEKQQQIK